MAPLFSFFKLACENIKYRADIDGLRAFAVVSVVINHYFPELLKGGFVGVDVFFVISGYLVTSIIYSNIKKNQFSISDFYWSRVRRLFPSLLLMLAVLFVAGWVLLLANEFSELGKQMVAGLSFVANFLFYSESGYFEKASVLKPLLHLWSLGVEEQFYLIWPLLIFLLGRLPKIRLQSILIFLCVVSFLFNIFYIQLEQIFVFYLLPGRLWELAVGAILAVSTEESSEKQGGLLRSVLSVMGLILLVISVFCVENSVFFPGFWALLPVLGAAFVIGAGSFAPTNKILSHPKLVFLGLISYPLYLWHWPVLSFANIVLSQEVSVYLRIALMGLSLLLAVLTFKYVELPLRKKKIVPRKMLIYLVVTAVMLSMAFFTWMSNGFKFRYPEIESARASILIDEVDEPLKPQGICLKSNAEDCVVAFPDRAPTVALLGDSHGRSLYFGLKKYYAAKNENLILVSTAGVAPLSGVKIQGLSVAVNADINLDFVSQLKSVHTVILTGFWASYFEEAGVVFSGNPYKNTLTDLEENSQASQNVIFKKSLEKTFKRMLALQKNVIFIHDVFKVPFKINKCLKRPVVSNQTICNFTRSEVLLEQNGYRSAVQEILSRYTDIQVFDPASILCPENTCEITYKGRFIYVDSHHLSNYGSELLSENFKVQKY